MLKAFAEAKAVCIKSGLFDLMLEAVMA
eukprot:COSAG02_NODE_45093_length_360_cov_0.793103_1_plen_27_part_01